MGEHLALIAGWPVGWRKRGRGKEGLWAEVAMEKVI